MTTSQHDGRIVLIKDTLKTLRRQMGVSQEKVAFLCAEQGLCVSIASLKRAETNKQVLYRTAKDIARFYSVDVTQIIQRQNASPSGQALAQTALATAPLENLLDARQLTDNSTFSIERNFILFTCLLEKDLSQLDGEVQDLQTALTHAAIQYGATLYDHTERGLCYTFGMDHTQGNEIKRAIHFGFQCLEITASLWRGRILVKIGLSCGKVSIQPCVDTPPIDRHYLNVGRAMATHAPSASVCMADNLQTVVGRLYELKAIFIAEGDKVWQVLKDRAYDSLLAEPASAALVGRKVELTQFKAILESSAEYSTTQIVHLTGAAGIGKSRLVGEFCHMASIDDFEIHCAAVLDFYVEQHQQVIPKLVGSLLGLKTREKLSDPRPLIHQENLRWLNQSKHLPVLYSLLGWQLPKQWVALLDAMSSEKILAEQCQLIADIIKTKAKQANLLIVIEDYHWANKQLRQTIHGFCRLLEDAPVVILFTARTGDAAQYLASQSESSALAVTQINLSPLAMRETKIFADSFGSVDESYREECIKLAQGNPLFLEQLLTDKWASLNLGLPFTLQSLVNSRIDQMALQDRQAACAASVIGQKFPLALVRYLMGNDDYEPSPLVSANIINGIDDEFSFNHALIMEGIYNAVAERDKKSIHVACSGWYTDDIVLQCHHLLKAEHVGASEKIVPAIQCLLQSYRFEEAKDLIDIGLSKQIFSALAGRLYELDAEVSNRLGDTPRALESYQNMLNAVVEPEEKVRALIGEANCRNTLDQFDLAMKKLKEAHKIAAANQAMDLLARIYYLNGNFLFPHGKAQECYQLQQQALYCAGQAGDKEMEARALGGLGDAAYAQGKMYSAYNYFKRCLSLCDDQNLKQVSAANLCMLGTVRIYQNETEQALGDAECSIQMSGLVGHKRAEIVSRLTAGWILLDWLRLDEALEHVDIALTLADDVGAKRFKPFLLESKAKYYWLNSNSDQAHEVVDEAIAMVEQLRAQPFIGPWLLGSKALMSHSWESAAHYLALGTQYLQQGCVGHNYFRFYVAAIETTLHHQRSEHTKYYIDQLKTYCQAEPTPWSDFHIERGEFLLRCQESSGQVDEAILALLINAAAKARLLTALPRLEAIKISWADAETS